MDYASLITEVRDMIPDGITEQKAEQLIARAEYKLERDLVQGTPPQQMLKRDDTLTTGANSALALPADCLTETYVQINGCPARYIRSERIAPGAEGFGQAPVTLDYIMKLPRLSDSAPQNWLILIAEDLYLWAACVNYAPYMQDKELMAQYGSWYRDAITSFLRLHSAAAKSPFLKQKGRPYCSGYTKLDNTLVFGEI